MTGTHLLIESNTPRAFLRLERLNAAEFTAELRSPWLRASALVAHLGGAEPPSVRLGAFFAGLAGHWQGWDGARTWRSIEGTLALSATTDHAGHVRIVAQLDDRAPFTWRATVELQVEAGQLDALAADAATFDRSLWAAV